VPANAGEHVARGAVLLTLDAAPFTAVVHEAEAQGQLRKVERDEAARDARQAQDLFDRTVLSTVELENAKNKLARAEAGVKEAGAALERARYHLRVSRLRAPFDAVILSRHAEPGQSISAELKSPVLFVIAAAGEYGVQARLPPERAAGLKVGQAVTVKVAGRSYPARLRAITHDPAGGKESYLLEAAFETSETLHAGLPARILLP
jgi:RND family efflux transporter MFP subunit